MMKVTIDEAPVDVTPEADIVIDSISVPQHTNATKVPWRIKSSGNIFPTRKARRTEEAVARNANKASNNKTWKEEAKEERNKKRSIRKSRKANRRSTRKSRA